MKTLTGEVKEFITDYVQNADFDYEYFKSVDDIVDNVITVLIDNSLIPELPSEREDNDELLTFIKNEINGGEAK